VDQVTALGNGVPVAQVSCANAVPAVATCKASARGVANAAPRDNDRIVFVTHVFTSLLRDVAEGSIR
jgi:hypothetical protein